MVGLGSHTESSKCIKKPKNLNQHSFFQGFASYKCIVDQNTYYHYKAFGSDMKLVSIMMLYLFNFEMGPGKQVLLGVSFGSAQN